METPEGFVPQEQHDATMAELRAELSEALNAKQTEINDLISQVVDANTNAQAQVIEEYNKLKAERDQFLAEATAFRNDNQALRKNLADYLMSTDGGKAALREFNIMVLNAQAEAIQKRLAELS